MHYRSMSTKVRCVYICVMYTICAELWFSEDTCKCMCRSMGRRVLMGNRGRGLAGVENFLLLSNIKQHCVTFLSLNNKF